MKKLLITLCVVAVVWYVFIPRTSQIKNVGNSGWHIVAFGDSLTYGQGAGTEQSYPAMLEKSLGRPVLNLGQNGETALDAAARTAEALQSEPYMVLIEFGGNDFMRSVRLDQTVAALEKIVDDVQNAGAVAVIVDTGGSSIMGVYTKQYKKIAKEKGAVFVPGILNGIMGKRALMSDKVHPNAQGYARIAKKIEKAIKPYLNEK